MNHFLVKIKYRKNKVVNLKIKIKNFRSFQNMEYIEIKPITILIGRNSSGKSSFLRTFPMLKQSLEKRTRSPILLYGDYVDFGSYQDIKPYYNKDNENYELCFIFEKNVFDYIKRNVRNFYYGPRYSKEEYFNIGFNVVFEEDKKDLLHIKELIYNLNGNEIKLELNHSKRELIKLTVNEESIIDNNDNVKYFDRGDFNLDFYIEDSKAESLLFSRRDSFNRLLEDKIVNFISTFMHGRTEKHTKINIVEDIKIGDDEFILESLKKKNPTSWFKTVSKWDINNKDFLKLKNLILAYSLIGIFKDPITLYFKETFLQVRYIAPLRATAERFYRIQHLAVNEVDPNGTNLPFFLDSLTDTQTKDFHEWTYENFGFKVKISKTEGHYSIKISHQEKVETNLSDMGFGYSQILPILTQLWYSSSKYDKHRNYSTRNIERIIVIEQPELHLHPEFQAKFADMLTKVIELAKQSYIILKIIIETHSDIIVNRLGDSILDGNINSKEINIVIFNKKSEYDPTDITFANFDNDGNLLNWPLGFFQPSIR